VAGAVSAKEGVTTAFPFCGQLSYKDLTGIKSVA
jgi:hypothetical protein